MKNIGVEASPEVDLLNELTPVVASLQKDIATLKYLLVDLNKESDIVKLADACCNQVLPKMEAIREFADKLERNVADKLWPFPKYTELFLNI
jgi:glutamine synthetase